MNPAISPLSTTLLNVAPNLVVDRTNADPQTPSRIFGCPFIIGSDVAYTWWTLTYVPGGGSGILLGSVFGGNWKSFPLELGGNLTRIPSNRSFCWPVTKLSIRKVLYCLICPEGNRDFADPSIPRNRFEKMMFGRSLTSPIAVCPTRSTPFPTRVPVSNGPWIALKDFYPSKMPRNILKPSPSFRSSQAIVLRWSHFGSHFNEEKI